MFRRCEEGGVIIIFFIITVILMVLINLLCLLVPKGPCDIHYGNPIGRPGTTEKVRQSNIEKKTQKTDSSSNTANAL